ncbi:MAG: universal stress protein [Armatimonadetes bacterium]|nr:universal stress protein [Armatimonadota bacterium]
MSDFAPTMVLHATDFSPSSEVALAWASLVARAYGARLEVLHAHHFETPPYFTSDQVQTLQEQLAGAKGQIEQQLEEMIRRNVDPSLQVTTTVVDQYPTEAILAAASERNPGLVVLGSHGRTGLARMMMGSVSENVLREIDVPLLITKTPASGEVKPLEVKHILCSTNYAPHSLRAIEVAASLAGKLGALLSVMHALESGGDVAAERERLCAWLPPTVQASCTWQPVVRGGNAAEQILQVAVEDGADLIVVGGRRRPLLQASVLGATTERVVRHAQCPVLTVMAE